ncbi:CHAT domain-containing protein [Hyunsoonleella sp. SJ7]|uniref:CHAT domain-containing protein n=1 Tax=Hyunsoonleella aquatilis TaxID=2762758 RepID=A0A923HFE4_9FLAO|nr:CHAT domain-containing protein [Hyunsoonleella aquatilis]
MCKTLSINILSVFLCILFLEKTNAQESINLSDIDSISYNKAKAFYNSRAYSESEKILHHLKKKINKKDSTHSDLSFKIFNLLGFINAYTQKLDSSTYYSKQALSFLEKTSMPLSEKFYNKGLLKNSISLNMFNSGRTQTSIEEMNDAITNLQKSIPLDTNKTKILKTRKRLYACIENLGGFYRGVGDNQRCLDLMNYAYQQKKQFLPEKDLSIIISELILAHIHLIAMNYKEADMFSNKGLARIDELPSWKSYALIVRSSIYENMEDMANAQRSYEKTEAEYRKNKTPYTFQFLDALIEMSLFYAKIGDKNKALSLAQEAYDYTHRDGFKNKLLRYFQTQNLADVNFALKNYKDALRYSHEALEYFSKDSLKLTSLLDSIQNETRKPRSLLVNIKSKYFLKENKSISFLENQIKETEKAVSVLETRKRIIKTHGDLEVLLNDNKDLIDFRKKLYLNLYEKTKNEAHLDAILNIHESSIYNRVRSRLNLKDLAHFNVHPKIINREKQLKERIDSVLAFSVDIKDYIKANKLRDQFLDSLKHSHPKYHKMRYATVFESLGSLQKVIPENTTIVRYLFIGNTLQVVILNQDVKKIIPLDGFNDSQKMISQLIENQSHLLKTNDLLFDLYKVLWKPFANEITTKNIIIIPDGDLYNLSFETLTPTKIESFKELSTNSLLAKHNISYNYSLYLIEQSENTTNYKNSFIAFAPEFNDKMKETYKLAITDSINLDKTYLTLLQQPFNVDLAKAYADVFDGNYFLNENSTERVFKKNASEHKIIHIGTHAESNNISPELSRLLFAKNISDKNEDGSLYAYEIYDTSLNSNLAILTACETGKPSYQAGEGMISLAHAFNYAGSESILTSLWKVDERSTSEIIELFYKNIDEGKPKNEALRLAKLDYIKNTEGRTVAPKFWAGLVLMGDVSPIEISNTTTPWKWLIFIGFVVIGILLFLKLRKANSV